MVVSDSYSSRIEASPDAVFALVVDVDRLSGWNDRVLGVVDDPGRLKAGSQWVVRTTLGGVRFRSRSTVLEIDAERRRFRYRSEPEGRINNGSYAVWTWEVEPDGHGSLVTLAWELNPRRETRLLVGFRNRQMRRKDAPASLGALGRLARAESS